MIAPRAPEDMDRWTRNERLYRHLLGMGLVVNPVFANEERTQIDHLIVSTDLPLAGSGSSEAPAVAGVGFPVERTKVSETIGPAVSDGTNVVDFPPVL